jgi:hypothetical protein
MAKKTQSTVESTTQKRAQLRRLADDVKNNIYEMLRLAVDILKDHAYVDDLGGEDMVIEMMQEQEFSHFGGAPSLGQMLRAWRANPKRETWKEYQFNVWAMIKLSTPQEERERPPSFNWKMLAKELETKLKALEKTLADTIEANDRLRDERDHALAMANKLEGRLEMLEKLQAV